MECHIPALKVITKLKHIENTIIDGELHVFKVGTPDHIKMLNEVLSAKIRPQKEFWLLDITDWNRIQVAYDQFQHMKLGLDVNLYLYMQGTTSNISIWEMYGIEAKIPKKIFEYGNWTFTNGLQLQNEMKWERRNDLEVN